MVLSLFLKKSVELHSTVDGGNLFQSQATALVKKYMVESECTSLHISLAP